MRLGFAIIVALLLADCSQSPPAPATMSIEFTWSDGAGPAFTYWMYASVEERAVSIDTPGKVLAAQSTMLSPTTGTAALDLENVPNGDNRVVVVTIRDGSDPLQSRALYLGYSERFSLEPGQSMAVPVHVELTPIPDPNGLSVQTSTPSSAAGHVTLAFTCSDLSSHPFPMPCDASWLYVARDVNLTEGLVILPASEFVAGRASRSTSEFDVHYSSIPYDLTLGCDVPLGRMHPAPGDFGACGGVFVMVRDARQRDIQFMVANPVVHGRALPAGSFLVPLAGSLRAIAIDDQKEHIYVLNATAGEVDDYSLLDHALAAPIKVGADPIDFDLSWDGATIVVTDGGPDQMLWRINLPVGTATATPIQTTVCVDANLHPLAGACTGTFTGALGSVAIDRGGSVWIARAKTTAGCDTIELTQVLFGPSGPSATRIFGQFLVPGGAWRLAAPADRLSLALAIPDAPAACGAPAVVALDFLPPPTVYAAMLDGGAKSIAIDGGGDTVLVNGSIVLNGDLSLRGTIPGGEGEAVIAPSGSTAYRLNGGRIEVLDLQALSVKQTIAIPDTVTGTMGASNLGRMAISRDGKMIAVITDRGFASIQVP
jgi:hypothetical protein